MREYGGAWRLTSGSVQTTVAIGRVVGSYCVAGDLIALDGELGAGKTQFVRGLAEGLGLDPRQVSSPTFVIAQEYERLAARTTEMLGGMAGDTPGAGAGRAVPAPVLVHLDAYRLRSAEDLASIGWDGDGAAMREDAVVAVEWAVLLGKALPEDRLSVRLEHESDGRGISLSAVGAWRARMQALADAMPQALDRSPGR